MSPQDTSTYAIDTEAESRRTLRTSLARSGVLTIGGQAAIFVIGTAGTVVLARLLTPADFGLLAMVYSLIQFIATFRDFGLPMAALQSRELDQSCASALFWLNLRLTIGVTLFMLAMGPVLAWFYGEPALVAINSVMTIAVATAALANQHEAMLTRQARFDVLVKWDVVFLAAGVAAAILLARSGAGYWSLVAQYMIWQSGRAIALSISCGWSPTAPHRLGDAGRRIRELVSFGAYLTGFRIIAHLSRDLDRILVGYISGPHSLGLYDAAHRWARLPIQQVYTPLLGVTVAGLSRVREDGEAYRRNVQTLLTPVLAMTFGVLTYAAVMAEPIIRVLLGRQWLAAVPLFRWLCIGMIAFSMLKTTKWLYVSMGDTRRQFQWGLISSPLLAAAVAVGAIGGAEGVAIAFTAANWALLWPGLAMCLRGTPVSVRQYFRIAALPAAASAIAGAALWPLLSGGALGSRVIDVLATAALYPAVFCAVWLVLPGGRKAARDMLRLVREMREHSANRGAVAGNDGM